MKQKNYIILILSIVLMTACNSKAKEFRSPDGKVKLVLPSDWVEYDDEEPGVYAFFNEKTWTGNLRITPIFIKTVADQAKNKLGKFIETELSENKGAVRFKLGQFDCVHYQKEITQEGEELTMFFWSLKQGNRIYVSSLTVDKARSEQYSYRDIVEEVQGIVESIESV